MGITMQIAGLIYGIKQSHRELRLCQTLSIAAKEVDWKGDDLFYLEDEQLLEGLKRMSKRYS